MRFALVLLLLAGCASAPTLPPDLEVVQLAPGVWMHTTWRTLEGGVRFPSNGLLVREGDELTLVDTAWGEASSEELLQWIERTHGPITRAIGTHFHDDRIGGADALQRRGIRDHVHPRTRELAKREELVALDAIASAGSATRVGPVEVFYPGPGHAEENVVVWIPRARILFGGCAVRPGDTKSLGNTADANLAAWPDSIRKVLVRYGDDVQIVIPGHGAPGSRALLEHTIHLLESRKPES